jgi:hypothetical protein
LFSQHRAYSKSNRGIHIKRKNVSDNIIGLIVEAITDNSRVKFEERDFKMQNSVGWKKVSRYF